MSSAMGPLSRTLLEKSRTVYDLVSTVPSDLGVSIIIRVRTHDKAKESYINVVLLKPHSAMLSSWTR